MPASPTSQPDRHGRIATVTAAGKRRYGLVADRGFVDLSARFGGQWPTLREVIEAGALRRIAEEAQGLPAEFALEALRFEIPIPAPEKIICVGVNFPDRNEEYKDGQAAPSNPSLFIRFPRSFVGHDVPLVRPPESPQLDYEGEIVLVIGKQGRRIPQVQALDHVAALSLCNEGTIRDWVRHGKFNVTQGKNFARSGSMGPWMVTSDALPAFDALHLRTRVNDELRQDDTTARLMFPFAALVAYLSTFMTLRPGDLVSTGTPAGAGARLDPPRWLRPGDRVEVEVEGIGVLANTVEDEKT